jgi:Spy/CpxP family protein refolding chaperone
MKSKIHEYKKNNFKIVSKKVFIIALLCVGFSICAQESTPTKKKGNKEAKSSQKMGDERLNKMTADLNLTPAQQEQMKPIIAEQTAKMDAMKAQQKANKEAGIQLSDADKKEMRKKMKEEKEANDAKIKNILTAEQFTKYQEMQKEQREKMMSQKKPKAD